MPPPAAIRKPRPAGWRARVGAALLLAAGCAGCTTGRTGLPDSNRRALARTPAIPENIARTDQALVAAFFAANGARLTPLQVAEILPAAAPPGRLDRAAVRRVATQKNRVLTVVHADEDYLWEALGRNQVLLVLLPASLHYRPATTPCIPVAWDRDADRLEVLDGSGRVQALSAFAFFARRVPLNHAALSLADPQALERSGTTREDKLQLADFWFDKGSYRRAGSIYAEVENSASDQDLQVEAIVGRGNTLVRKGRYKEAIQVFQAALALDPDNPRVLNNLAYAMLQGQGELLVALRHATRAARLDPDNPVILETIGSINLKLGDPDEAAKNLEMAWARASKHPPEVQVAILDQLVRAWNSANRKDLAWQVAEHRWRTFPQFAIPKDILFLFPDLKKAPPPPESDQFP